MVAMPTAASRRADDVHRRLPPASPEPILQLALGFMAAKHLFTATELGLFEALADSPATVDGLAARTGLPHRSARICADAMVALGLLERNEDWYCNGEAAAAYLAGEPGTDLRPLLHHLDRSSYPVWCDLSVGLAQGTHRRSDAEDDHGTTWSPGSEAVAAGPAEALARVFDFSCHQRLLDLGGGSGAWSTTVARWYPHLEVTVLGLPLADRLPSGHDVFLIANLLHCWSAKTAVAELQRVRGAAPFGAPLLLVDFWTDATRTEPLAAALLAGEFALCSPEGDVYSVDEARGWLADSGWRFVDDTPLAGGESLIVAVAA